MNQVDFRHRLQLTCGLPTEMHPDLGWALISERFFVRRFLLHQLCWTQGSFERLVAQRISSLVMVFGYHQTVWQQTFALDLAL